MKTLKTSFKEQLGITDEQLPELDEVLEFLSKLFQKAISDPKEVTHFHKVWDQVVEGLKKPEGLKEIKGEVTLGKIKDF